MISLWSAILCLIVCITLLYITFSPRANEINAKTLSASRMLHHVKRYIDDDLQSPIDIIILPPSIGITDLQDEKNPININYTILSLLKFCPWIRTFHFYNPKNTRPHKTVTEYWLSKSRFVEFVEKPSNYIATSPLLSEQFLILSPKTLITESLFPWQFFIEYRDTHDPKIITSMVPVFRTGANLLIPLTRVLYNSILYTENNEDIRNDKEEHTKQESSHSMNLASDFKHIIEHMRRNQLQMYVNNQDGYNMSSLKYEYKEEKRVLEELLSQEANVSFQNMNQNENVNQNQIQNLNVIVHSNLDLQTYDEINQAYKDHPKFNLNNKVIWINLYTSKSDFLALERVQIYHKTLTRNQLFFEVPVEVYKWNTEKIGSIVMEYIYKMKTNIRMKNGKIDYFFTRSSNGLVTSTNSNESTNSTNSNESIKPIKPINPTDSKKSFYSLSFLSSSKTVQFKKCRDVADRLAIAFHASVQEI